MENPLLRILQWCTEAKLVLHARIDRRSSDELQKKLAEHEYGYGKLGLTIGLICVLGGIGLFLNGIAGSTSWTAKVIGAESEISDAAPGAVLFVVGVFIVFITRPKFEHK